MKKALLTIVRNEPILLPIWINYYRQFFNDKDIYLIDNNTNDESIANAKKSCDFNIIRENEQTENSDYITKVIKKWQTFLFTIYDLVLMVSVDEFVVPDPLYIKNLNEYFDFFMSAKKRFVFLTGFNVLHEVDKEPPIDWTKPLLNQRKYWNHSYIYCKPALSKCALDWDRGMHSISGIEPHLTGNLASSLIYNIHIRRIDWNLNLTRWKKEDKNTFMKEFEYAELIPERFKKLL